MYALGTRHQVGTLRECFVYEVQNVKSNKKALIKKDLIDVDGQEISFSDSLFKLWLKRQTVYGQVYHLPEKTALLRVVFRCF